MRFWDTSALIPLCVVEPTTAAIQALADADPGLVVWWTSRTECVSALQRGRREGHLDAAAVRHGQAVLVALQTVWTEVLPNDGLRTRAERLLAVHPLRAADAFQLAAALLWCRGETAARGFVCLDERLRDAAQRVVPS